MMTNTALVRAAVVEEVDRGLDQDLVVGIVTEGDVADTAVAAVGAESGRHGGREKTSTTDEVMNSQEIRIGKKTGTETVAVLKILQSSC
jgi:hypothetical protein